MPVLGVLPYVLISNCAFSTLAETRSYDLEPYKSKPGFDTKYIAHRPELVMWDLVSEMLEDDPDNLYMTSVREMWSKTDGQRTRDTQHELVRFRASIHSVLTFFDREKDDESMGRQSTVQFVENMLARYEDRTFSRRMIDHWDLVWKEIKSRS